MFVEQAVILIISILAILISFLLFRRAAGTMSLFRINMLSFLFYVPFVLMSFLGAVLVALKLDDHYLMNKMMFEKTRLMGWGAVLYTMIVFPIGLLLAKKLFSIRNVKEKLNQYALKPISNQLKSNEIILRFILLGLSLIGISVLGYTFFAIGTVPIMEMLQGQDNLAQLRQTAGREFAGNVYLKNLFGIQLLPILAFIALAYYEKKRNNLELIWTLILFGAALLMLTYDLQKATAALFLSGIIFYITLVHGKISKAVFLVLGFSAFAIILGFYFATSDADIKEILLSYNTGIVGRVLFSSIAGTFLTFEHFNDTHPHIGLSSLSSFVEIFSIEYSERSARLMMETVNPKGVQEGKAGVLNSLFIAEAWANFGLTGLLLSPLYVGFVIGSLFYALLKFRKTPVMIGLYVFFSYKITIGGGFNDYLYHIGNVFIFALFIIILFVAEKLRKNLSTA